MNAHSLFSPSYHFPFSRRAVVTLLALVALVWIRPAFCDEILDAARDGDVKKVQALINGNPDLVLSKDGNGLTALHWAAGRGHRELVELLMASKADVNAKSGNGSTPLHLAAFNGHKDVAELLLANHAEVNAKNNDGWTPLHGATRYDHLDVAELLVANGADVNAKVNNGSTPLHMAAALGYKGLAELLLDHQADVNVKESHGFTPLQLAESNSQPDVAELLRQHIGQGASTPTQAAPTTSAQGDKHGAEALAHEIQERPANAGEIKEMIAEISRRITPFNLLDAQDGFKGQLESSDNVLRSSFAIGEMTTSTIARQRPMGDRTSVEILRRNGSLVAISFKNVAGNSGFSEIWAAKPAVILSDPTTASTSGGVGFNRVALLNGGVATEYRIVGPNVWSVSTHPDQEYINSVE